MKRLFTALAVGLAVVLAVASGLLQARQDKKPRTDQEYLIDIKKLTNPEEVEKELSKLNDEKAILEALKKRGDATLALLGEMEKAHPKSPHRAEATLWALRLLGGFADDPTRAKRLELAKGLKGIAEKGSGAAAHADLELLMGEVNESLKGAKSEEELKARWAKDAEARRKRITDYMAAYPKYTPGVEALGELVELSKVAGDPKTSRLILEMVAKNVPDHPLAKLLKREEGLGKEFVFEFVPVGTDKKSSLKDLRGKVVVIDFWATWCGPCKAEMPKLKELYEKHSKQGVEFIGVSLDEADKPVKDYVKENKIAWPQVQGEAAGRLAQQWGVNAIPTMFVVDKKGNLRNVEARGQLEALIPELLAEK